MSLMEQIETIVAQMTDNNIPSKLVTIIKGYDTPICDIESEGVILRNIQCSGLADHLSSGLLVYLDGDETKPFVLLFTDLSNYYTKKEIDEIIEEIIGGQIDLKDYVKKRDVYLKFDLEDNGTITIGIDVGDGF